MTLHISRRTALKGLGTAVALPFLEAMLPATGWAATVAPKKPSPRRMAFVYVPNGIHMKDWTPAAEGKDFDLPPTLEALKPLKDRLLVMTGLTCDKARPNGDGPGDHARAMSAFLTGSQPYKTHGADIKVGISVDQFAAQKIGDKTKFASLEIGCDRGAQAGNCDSGYSCAYSSTIAWKTESTPVAKEIDPRQVFERLFGSSGKTESDAARAKREQYKKSVLDFVQEDATALRNQLGATDQRKLDEYLTAVREIEQRIERTEKTTVAAADVPKIAKPTGVPRDYAEHIRILSDLLVLSFQADLTRVATFVFANEGSNKSYKFIEVPEGHHDLSHHGGDKDKQAKIAKINRFHIGNFAYLLEKLNGVQEADGSLLDNSMIVYGSGNSDGNRHNHDDLPMVMAGKAGGSIKPGRHLRFARNTPLCNLFLNMLDILGAPTEKFGDSKGRLEGLA